MSHSIAILNTSILTNDGSYTMSSVGLDEVIELMANNNLLSAIGHQSTADILSELTGFTVPLNRIQFAQEVGQQAIIFKLNGRPEEGKILSRAEIESIGYSFKILCRTA